MSNLISKKSELLFLYDIETANPNGDPLNENRPRYDNETSTILVSDVRLKRTIRDYWFEYEGFDGKADKDIFVREITFDEKGKKYIQDGKRRAGNFENSPETILGQCIDIRVFGGVMPLENSSITYTGATQFQMGRSLHRVEIVTEQGTGAFASGAGKEQKTFRTEYKIPYAIIGFNGVINDKAAQSTKMTEDDKELLFTGLWEGTKSLISRSKFGQKPLLLISVNYKDSYYLGGLRQKVKLVPNTGIAEEGLRSTNDYVLDVTELFEALSDIKNKIESFDIKCDKSLKFSCGGNVIPNISDLLNGLIK